MASTNTTITLYKRNQIGRAVRSLREKYNLTLRQLSEKSRVDVGMIRYIEIGFCAANIDTLNKVLAVFQLQVGFTKEVREESLFPEFEVDESDVLNHV